MVGDMQGGFKRGRRIEANLFMLERMIEISLSPLLYNLYGRELGMEIA